MMNVENVIICNYHILEFNIKMFSYLEFFTKTWTLTEVQNLFI